MLSPLDEPIHAQQTDVWRGAPNETDSSAAFHNIVRRCAVLSRGRNLSRPSREPARTPARPLSLWLGRVARPDNPPRPGNLLRPPRTWVCDSSPPRVVAVHVRLAELPSGTCGSVDPPKIRDCAARFPHGRSTGLRFGQKATLESSGPFIAVRISFYRSGWRCVNGRGCVRDTLYAVRPPVRDDRSSLRPSRPLPITRPPSA